MRAHSSRKIPAAPAGGASRFSGPSRGFIVPRNEAAEPLSLEARQERAALYGHNIQHLRPVAPSSPSGLDQSAPIQRQPKEKKKKPSFFQTAKDFFVPKTSTVKTPEGHDVSVRSTYPSHWGLTRNHNFKTWVNNDQAKGHGIISLSETGEKFHTQSMTKKHGKGVSNMLHQGVAQHVLKELGVIPKDWTSSWTSTSAFQRGNEHQAKNVEDALRKTNPNPTPEELAKAQAYGVNGEKPVAGAKAKLNVGYKPVSYLGGLYRSQHPNPIFNTDPLKTFSLAQKAKGKSLMGTMIALGLSGGALYGWNQQNKKRES
jgi:hypothetical protein